MNRYDNPRENIHFIRETVSSVMHAISEAIGKGKFHGYELKADSRQLTEVKKRLAHDYPLEKLLRNAIFLKVRNGL